MKKEMTKLLSFLLVGVCIFALSGCGKDDIVSEKTENNTENNNVDDDILIENNTDGNVNLTEEKTTTEIGEIIKFGAYEQDNDTTNGKEDIEWLVLDKKDGKVLVISKYALDCKRYNTYDIDIVGRTDVTWEICTLRKWLNDDFINSAFSTEEKAMILTTTVSADKNPYYDTNPGNVTKDQVFLLSIKEVEKYFSSDSERQCAYTDYAAANGVHYNGSNCWWWLRSPGIYQFNAAYVDIDGNVYEDGFVVDINNRAIRPALWINLE